ncbi:lytic transglycosylase domain-containing protein [uncultured Paraglaciecola sp.]|jgi:soluble lytic murein transglycosylase|uniref:lytic transglycosylase domain-containing protein n=1 Tax=uncultured Paraglaciecola sp. TaxID=1765024 RepID=UPI002610E0DA|nr:lytic transglycosylase domain-containing protein [uncultured Paraglaciecola sp.]
MTALFTQTAVAAPKLDREQQRNLFIKAEGLAYNPNSNAFKKVMKQLEGYPLKPYVELKTLSKFPFMANKKQIERFLAQYESSPLDRHLRKKWLFYLAKKNQPEMFMHAYRDMGNVALNCKYAQMLLQKDPSNTEAFELAENLWVVGKSQPNDCNELFKAWHKAGKRTSALVWKRVSLAADGGNHTLLPYLKTLMPKKQQYLADLWLKVRRSPSQVSRLSNFPGQFPEKETEILVYGLKRLISSNRDLALRSWKKLSRNFTFSRSQQKQISHQFATFLALVDHEQAEFWLEKATSLEPDAELLRWHLAHVLRQKNWQNALDVINLVPGNSADNNVFQYWKAQAYEQVGAKALADEGLHKLAKQRHYYGFLASGKLSEMASLNDNPLLISQEEIDEVAALPSAQRAFEFRKLSRNLSARREWISLQGQLTHQQKITAAVLASQQNWHDQAIFGFSKSGYLDDLSRRFPMPFDSQMQSNAKKNNIDVAWVYAIVRRESSFMPDAASHAGALGLMQVMPRTARYLAKKKIKKNSLFNANRNVELGTQYMRYLMDKMDNNAILATASYNAGWRRVQQWLPEKGNMPLDLWIETIPYKETRNYVKAVLAYQQIYSQHLGGNENLFKKLATMEIQPKS